MLGNLHPHGNGAVLQILELPESCAMETAVAVPALVLASRERVHVDDRVDTFRSADIDDAVHETESLGLDDIRLQIVHEMAMVDGDAKTVQTDRLEELGVLACEEVVQKFLEEEVIFLLSENLEKRETDLMLVTREAGDEVLDHQ